MQSFIVSLLILFAAEMGDKTQLLALYFSTKFKLRNAVLGVVGTILILKFIQTVIGSSISRVLPLSNLQIIAGITFILIGVYLLFQKPNKSKNKIIFKPHHMYLTILATYFIAELGDKSEISTILLASQNKSFLAVWLGTSAGMIAADLIAIFIGHFLGKRIRQDRIRQLSAILFIILGAFSLWQTILK